MIVLSSVRAGSWVAVIVTLSLSEVIGVGLLSPLNVKLPEAVAVFVTEPASRSAWVAPYVAEQVIVAPGARLAVGRAALVGRLVVADRERPVDGDVAGVGDEVAVGQGVADRVVRDRGRALVDRQRRGLDAGRGRAVGRVDEGPAGRRCRWRWRCS